MVKITGNPQKLERIYRKAERLCRRAFAKGGDSETHNAPEILAQIVARNPERP